MWHVQRYIYFARPNVLLLYNTAAAMDFGSIHQILSATVYAGVYVNQVGISKSGPLIYASVRSKVKIVYI